MKTFIFISIFFLSPFVFAEGDVQGGKDCRKSRSKVDRYSKTAAEAPRSKGGRKSKSRTAR